MQFKHGDRIIYHRSTGAYKGTVNTKKERIVSITNFVGIVLDKDWKGIKNAFWSVHKKHLELVNNHETEIAENYSI